MPAETPPAETGTQSNAATESLTDGGAVDYRELIKRVERVAQEIEQADDQGTTVQALAEAILRRFHAQLGLAGGRVYRRDGEDFELVATFGDAAPVRRPLRVPASYEPIQILEDRGAVYMEAEDERVDPELERQLGVRRFAAIQVDVDIILAFDVLRHSITQRLREERLQGLLREARRIQASITPRHDPAFGNFDVHGEIAPMEIVGGDFYDFIPITDKILGVAIADVSGHGLPAALQVRDIHMGLRMGLSRDLKIVRTVERMNAIIHASTLTSRFASLFYGELELNGNFIYVNAGHPAPVHLRNDGQEIMLEEGGAVLGPIADATYERGFIKIRPGETVVFYTDGIVETQRLVGDESWEEFGVERLLAVLRKHRDRAAADIVRAVFDDVERFSGRRLPRDDRTIVVVKRAVEPT
jgi:serine phosphatase RsbU (regulator of sigma subunit)